MTTKQTDNKELIWFLIFMMFPAGLLWPMAENFAEPGITRTLISGVLGGLGAIIGFGVYSIVKTRKTILKITVLIGLIALWFVSLSLISSKKIPINISDVKAVKLIPHFPNDTITPPIELDGSSIKRFINDLNKASSNGICKYYPLFKIIIYMKDGTERNFEANGENIKELTDECFKIGDLHYFAKLYNYNNKENPDSEPTSETIKNSQTDSLTLNKKKEPSFYQKNFKEIGLSENIGSKTLKQYLSDDRIPKLFKTIFQSKGIKLNDDIETLSIIDSLFSKDKERHPFYFILLTRTMWWADGAYAEPLGLKAKEYIENETNQFLRYFDTEKVLTNADFNNWADEVAMEIGISSENHERQEIENVKTRMIKNCNGCSKDDLKIIDNFIAKIKEYSP